jgi:hypothetical protein
MVLLHQHLVGSILLNLPIKLARHQDHPYLQKVSAFKYLGNSLCFDDDATRRDALQGHPQNCLQLMRTYLAEAKTHTCLPINISILKLVLKIVSTSVNICLKSISKSASKTLGDCSQRALKLIVE